MKGTILIEAKCESGLRQVKLDDEHIGDIVITEKRMWLAIPLFSRNLPMTAHKLARDAITALR